MVLAPIPQLNGLSLTSPALEYAHDVHVRFDIYLAFLPPEPPPIVSQYADGHAELKPHYPPMIPSPHRHRPLPTPGVSARSVSAACRREHDRDEIGRLLGEFLRAECRLRPGVAAAVAAADAETNQQQCSRGGKAARRQGGRASDSNLPRARPRRGLARRCDGSSGGAQMGRRRAGLPGAGGPHRTGRVLLKPCPVRGRRRRVLGPGRKVDPCSPDAPREDRALDRIPDPALLRTSSLLSDAGRCAGAVATTLEPGDRTPGAVLRGGVLDRPLLPTRRARTDGRRDLDPERTDDLRPILRRPRPGPTDANPGG